MNQGREQVTHHRDPQGRKRTLRMQRELRDQQRVAHSLRSTPENQGELARLGETHGRNRGAHGGEETQAGTCHKRPGSGRTQCHKCCCLCLRPL